MVGGQGGFFGQRVGGFWSKGWGVGFRVGQGGVLDFLLFVSLFRMVFVEDFEQLDKVVNGQIIIWRNLSYMDDGVSG